MCSRTDSATCLRPLQKHCRRTPACLSITWIAEGLMREILFRLREREDARIQAWFQAGRNHERYRVPTWLWQGMSARSKQPQLRLLFELYALRPPPPERLSRRSRRSLVYWKRLTKKASRQSKADEPRQPAPGGYRGLLLDLCAPGIGFAWRAMQLLVSLSNPS